MMDAMCGHYGVPYFSSTGSLAWLGVRFLAQRHTVAWAWLTNSSEGGQVPG